MIHTPTTMSDLRDIKRQAMEAYGDRYEKTLRTVRSMIIALCRKNGKDPVENAVVAFNSLKQLYDRGVVKPGGRVRKLEFPGAKKKDVYAHLRARALAAAYDIIERRMLDDPDRRIILPEGFDPNTNNGE